MEKEIKSKILGSSVDYGKLELIGPDQLDNCYPTPAIVAMQEHGNMIPFSKEAENPDFYVKLPHF